MNEVVVQASSSVYCQRSKVNWIRVILEDGVVMPDFNPDRFNESPIRVRITMEGDGYPVIEVFPRLHSPLILSLLVLSQFRRNFMYFHPVTHGTKKRSQFVNTTQPEKVLTTIGKSVNDPQKYHKKKHYIHTVEEVQ